MYSRSVGYWIFSSILVPCLLSSGCPPWTLDIPCWLLDIEYLAVLLDIGYSVLSLSLVFCLPAVPLGHWTFRVGYWIFSSILVPCLLSSGCPAWTLDIPCWLLDIEYLAVLLDIGYSPALRDPAGRDGILGVEMSSYLVNLTALALTSSQPDAVLFQGCPHDSAVKFARGAVAPDTFRRRRASGFACGHAITGHAVGCMRFV